MTERSVVVTGASTGIGRATALHLDNLGLRVFAGVRRPEDGEALRHEASERLQPLQLDVTSASDIEAAVRTVAAAAPDSLAGIVNNAGIAIAGPVEFVAIDDWRRQFEINLFGVVAMVQAFTPLLRTSGGRVVTVGSLGGRLAQPFAAPYCASKHALEALSDALRIELRPWGIAVALVQPGAVRTPIWEKGMSAGTEMLKSAPRQIVDLYGAALQVAQRIAAHENETGVPPAEVARAIEHALTARRPRTRYAVGRQARLLIPLTRVLPDRLKDEMLLRFGKLPRSADATGAVPHTDPAAAVG